MADITGTPGNDNLGGTAAADRLIGNDGDDVLIGRGGDDRLFGGDGSDIFYGGAGDDLIRTGTNVGVDRLWGGLGNDTYDLRDSVPASGFALFEFDYRLMRGSIDVRIGPASGTVAKTADGSTDRLVNLQDSPLAWGISILGTLGDDTIRVNTTTDTFTQIGAAGGADRVFGGNGFDRLAYNSELLGGGVSVRITGYSGGGMDGIVDEGFGTRDVFRRIDEIQGSRADDVFLGGDGDDRFITDSGDDSVNGGAGTDRIRYDRDGLDGILANLAAGEIVKDWVGGGFGRVGSWLDTVRNVEDIRGSRGDDRILGDDAANLLEGRSGDDQIQGGGGDDDLRGEEGADRVLGDAGNDRIEGGSGDDRLFGGAGEDHLFDGAGNDILRGDAGADVFAFQGSGSETILDFEDGVDRIAFDGATGFADIDRARSGDDTVLTFGAHSVTVLTVLPGQITADDFDFAFFA